MSDLPAIFPDEGHYALALLIMAGAQLINATVGFGAGIFSVALLALLLPDLTRTVPTIFVLIVISEVWVLLHAGRAGRAGILFALLPSLLVGIWLGTTLLASGPEEGLKRILGVVVVLAGTWFLYEETRPASGTTSSDDAAASPAGVRSRRRGDLLWSVPVGLAAGTLGGLFGTGGPPVILFLKSFRLDKGAFRATLLWTFLLMSVLRGVSYLEAGLLTGAELHAAAWLLPGSALGTALGMALHRRLPERHFAPFVSVLLVALGLLLVFATG